MDALSALLERPIAFNRAYKVITGSTVAALFLSQAVYWQNRSTGWFYKTIEQWEDETGLTRREQETARRILKNIGVLVEEKRGVPCRLYYKVDLERLIELLQTSKAKGGNPVCQDSVSNIENSHKNSVLAGTSDKLKRKKRQTRARETSNPVCQDSASTLENFAKNEDFVQTFDKQVCTEEASKVDVSSLAETCKQVCTNAPNINYSTETTTETTLQKSSSNFFDERDENQKRDAKVMKPSEHDEAYQIPSSCDNGHCKKQTGAAVRGVCAETGEAENAQESLIAGERVVDSPNVQPCKENRSGKTRALPESKPRRPKAVETEAEREFRESYYEFAKRATDWLVAHGGVQEEPARYWAWAKRLNKTDKRVTIEVMKQCFNVYAQVRTGVGWRGRAKSFRQFVASFGEIFQFLNNLNNTTYATHQGSTIASVADPRLQREFDGRSEWLNVVNSLLAHNRRASGGNVDARQ